MLIHTYTEVQKIVGQIFFSEPTLKLSQSKMLHWEYCSLRLLHIYYRIWTYERTIVSSTGQWYSTRGQFQTNIHSSTLRSSLLTSKELQTDSVNSLKQLTYHPLPLSLSNYRIISICHLISNNSSLLIERKSIVISATWHIGLLLPFSTM